MGWRMVQNSDPNLQYAPSEIQTDCELTADSLLTADSPASPGGRSGQQDPTKTYRPNRSKRSDSRTREEHNEQPAAELLADSPPTPRGRSARCGNSSPSLKIQA
jgi:hypothetical protein